MRILALADIHGARIVPTLIANFIKTEAIDCIIINGDITNFGPLSVAEEILKEITKNGILTLALPGNCDPRTILNVLKNSSAFNLHGKSKIVNDIAFIGLGGSNLTPFNTPFELTEEEIEITLKRALSEVKRIPKKVLITHAPPKNTRADITSLGLHVGSEIIRRIIEDTQPLISICAHVHEARTLDRVCNTLIINPGPISRKQAALIQIENKIDAKLIEL